MPGGNTILIVDDENEIRKVLSSYLEKEGFRVLTAPDGAAMSRQLEAQQVDLILLDILLPDANGFELVRDLRRSSDIPVILLTGKSESVDKVVGLELGADDYLSKPFELRELLARIRSVWRRYQAAQRSTADHPTAEVKVFAGWALDQPYRRLYSPKGVEVELTSREFELLRELVNHPNQPVSRDHLLGATRSRHWVTYDRSIDMSITRLRKKIEKDPKRPKLIRTIRNVGYVLAADVTNKPRQDLT